jgi:hypothetical protein
MKTKPFEHFLITRFNLRVINKNSVIDKVWENDRNNNPIQTEEWLKKRIYLFETFCLPSISIQSCKDFKWYVYFDLHSPKIVKEKIKEWKKMNSYFHPILKASYDQFMNDLSSDIANANTSSQYIITTRLDNDDALHKDAVLEIQKSFIPKHNVPINMPLGHCLLFKNNFIQVSTLFHSADGPFLSLIEKGNDVNTVYQKKHTEYGNNPGIIQIGNKALWLQIIHETNMLNFLRGRVKRPRKLYNNFGVRENIQRYNITKEIVQDLWHLYRVLLPSKYRKFILNMIFKTKK